MNQGSSEDHVVRRLTIYDQEFGRHVDPFSVYWEDNHSGRLLDFAAEADEWGYLACQSVFL
ncbi:hypothetical protein F2Q70_00043605 [Brassica cretica]|uniref:Uncharacterized protein n=1 Tax=Brassica cretica TaxID=69181 RepID=A0A8S9KNG0_BRACR|nr:hypothetical protein F2Q70_00043605 [Brassica cretica]